MEIIARHLTIDMYRCKTSKLTDSKLMKESFMEMLVSNGFHVLHFHSCQVTDDHFSMIAMLKEGHLTIHAYAALNYVAADVFLCESDADPEKFFKAVRSFFKPEKNRTTYLKRGDFRNVPDMKPKTKTRHAPLRRIHNTGSKVIRLIAHRNNRHTNY